MQRHTKEFQEVKAGFEKAVKEVFFGYISGDLTPDNYNANTFYMNGQVNQAFRIYMAGYAAAKHEYQQ